MSIDTPGQDAAPPAALAEARLREDLADALADADRQRRRSRDAERRLALKRTALDLVPVGVLIAAAPSGEVISSNAAALRLTGRTASSTAPLPPSEAVCLLGRDGAPLPADRHPLTRIIAGGEDRLEEDMRCRLPNGETRWLRVIGEGIRDRDGDLTGAALAMLDVEEEHRASARQDLLVAELNHRVKNVFASLSAIAGRSLRGSPELEEAGSRLRDRIHAYAESHAMLVQAEWNDGPLADVARITLRSFIAEGRVRIAGDDLRVTAKVAMSLSLAFHELATNATKYGALSNEAGRIDLTWRAVGDGYVLRWTETGGPPPRPGLREGFGAFVTRDAVSLESGGEVTHEWPETGLVWTLTV